jgi:hypothetical protein
LGFALGLLRSSTTFQQASPALSDASAFNGSPAMSQGQLFLRSDKCLYCIGKK